MIADTRLAITSFNNAKFITSILLLKCSKLLDLATELKKISGYSTGSVFDGWRNGTARAIVKNKELPEGKGVVREKQFN